MPLTLNERSYLRDILKVYIKDLSPDDLWDLTEFITYKQRAKILALDMQRRRDRSEIIDMVENIRAFQMNNNQDENLSNMQKGI